MKNPRIAALCAGAVVALPSIAMSAAASDDRAVRNGSFDQGGTGDWMRSNPELALPGSQFCTGGEDRCDDPRLISIGRSVVHAPRLIEAAGGLPIRNTDRTDSCDQPVDERTSVLRLRANHPVAPARSVTTIGARPVVGNVFQTDISLSAPPAGSSGEDAVILLRFDHFGLHPLGGPALEARLIAERSHPDGCELVDWGDGDWRNLPFHDQGWDAGCDILVHTMNVLGSPRYRCVDPSGGEEVEQWLPRQMSQAPYPLADDPCRPMIDAVPSLVASQEVDPPSADWRTVELRVAVDRLPGWDCDGSLDQIEDYRFTIAFRLPEELMLLNTITTPGDLACDDGVGPCDWAIPGGAPLQQSWRFPAYSEVDQVELRLASLDEFGPCDLEPFCPGDDPVDSSRCRTASAGTPFAVLCKYQPVGTAIAVAEDGPVEAGLDAPRRFEVIAYETSDGSSDITPVDSVEICRFCAPNEENAATAHRPIGLQDFEPATPLAKACPGDFNGDGRVDGRDFGVLLGEFGCRADCVGDLDGDGRVDGADIGLFGAYWGPCE